MRSLPLGTTFSQRVLRERGQNVEKALEDLLSLKFDLVRLGVYWDECESSSGQYDFSEIRHILTICESRDQKVLLTVGAKAPRWPEFYVPAWVTNESFSSKVLSFVENAVQATQTFSCIQAWQVENEPLDPSGPENRVLETALLQEEVTLVRSLDTRPIWVNVWGNDLSLRGFFSSAQKIADVIGLDLYPKQHVITTPFGSFYRGPLDATSTLQKIINTSPQPVWITELQAEPWEKSDEVYWSLHPKSFSPQQFEQNLSWARTLQPAGILLWGFEYWWQKREQGDSRYWRVVESAV